MGVLSSQNNVCNCVGSLTLTVGMKEHSGWDFNVGFWKSPLNCVLFLDSVILLIHIILIDTHIYDSCETAL